MKNTTSQKRMQSRILAGVLAMLLAVVMCAVPVLAASKEITINIKDKAKDKEIGFYVYKQAKDGLPIPILNGEKVDVKIPFYISVTNPTKNVLLVNQIDASGKLVKTVKIDPVDEDGFPGFKIFKIKNLISDTTFVLEKEIKKVQKPTIKIIPKVVSAKAVAKKAATISALKVAKAFGKLKFTAEKGSSKYLKVNPVTGKITVKKGAPKGKHVIYVKITAGGDSGHLKFTQTVKATIYVK